MMRQHLSRAFAACPRNVKGFVWNHKRVYRIYRERELNLRIKPRKRLVREQPQPLAVPQALNECWSMDFMHDQLADCLPGAANAAATNPFPHIHSRAERGGERRTNP